MSEQEGKEGKLVSVGKGKREEVMSLGKWERGESVEDQTVSMLKLWPQESTKGVLLNRCGLPSFALRVKKREREKKEKRKLGHSFLFTWILTSLTSGLPHNILIPPSTIT